MEVRTTGYDCYWEELPADVEAANIARHAAFEAAVRERDGYPADSPERVLAQATLEKVLNTGQPNYFRLNIWGMGTCRELMWERGMLADKGWPAWPKLEDFGLTEYPGEEDGGEEIEYWPEDSPQRKYLEAADQLRSGDTGGVIPAYKLGSNDGWLVTPEEIGRSLEALGGTAERWALQGVGDPREAPQGEDGEGQTYAIKWWPEWLAWLEAAKEHGGFRVY